VTCCSFTIYLNIYIYIYVCVCVCIYEYKRLGRGYNDVHVLLTLTDSKYEIA